VIRLTWREFRSQVIIALGALVIATAVLAITGANLVHLYNTTVANCQAIRDCSTATSVFINTDSQLQTAVDAVMIAIPALLGIFWGAPLIARELEAGTHRLAWTQSVTRTRWLAVKIGGLGIGSLLVTGLLSVVVTWWFSPVDRANANIFASFDQRDIVPLGYAAFAFALGVTSGALLRRTLPAMATTVVGFVAVRLAVQQFVRPNIVAPLHKTVSDTVFGSLVGSGLHSSVTPAQVTAAQSGLPPNGWIISDQTINGAGHVVGQNGLVDGGINFTQGMGGYALTIQGAGTCPRISPGPPTNPGPLIQKCVEQLHLRNALIYQPGARYWLFQWCELAIFAALAIVLVGFCFWWVRRLAA
jgi:hypothetical protein